MSNWYIDNINFVIPVTWYDKTCSRHYNQNDELMIHLLNLLISWISNNGAFADATTKASVEQPEKNNKNFKKKLIGKKYYQNISA